MEARSGKFSVPTYDFRGPFEPRTDQIHASKRYATYVYDGNTLTKHEQSVK